VAALRSKKISGDNPVETARGTVSILEIGRSSPRVLNLLDVELAKRLRRSSMMYPILAVMQALCFLYFDQLQIWQIVVLGCVCLLSLGRYVASERLLRISVSTPIAIQRHGGLGRFPFVLKGASLGIAALWAMLFSEVFVRERLTGHITPICLLQTLGFSVGATVALASSRKTALLFQAICLVPLATISVWVAYTGGGAHIYAVAFMAWIQFVYTSQFTRITGKDLVDSIVYQDSLRRANLEISDSQKRLESESEKAFQASLLASLGRMAGGVAHEINNPLTIALGNIRQIRAIDFSDGASPLKIEKLMHKLGRVQSALDRMAKVVGSLMVFVRQESTANFESVDIREVVKRSVHAGYAHDPRVQVDLPESAALVVCQVEQISQVIDALIANASEAVENAANPLVKVSVTVSDETAAVWVQDSGPGLPPGVLEKMFDPFFTTKPVGKGSGLGLAVSRALALSNGGSLEFVSNQPLTTFVLRLRRAAEGVGQGAVDGNFEDSAQNTIHKRAG